MTTIVTRLYADLKAARTAAGALGAAGMPSSAYDVIGPGGDTMAALAAARVSRDNAAAYAPRIGKGAALVVARAPVTPFGLARKVMDTLDGFDSVRVPGVVADEYVRETIGNRYYLSVLTNHPHMFGQDLIPGSLVSRGPVTAAFGMRMLSRHRAKRSAIAGGRHMSRAFWPMPLVIRRARTTNLLRDWKLSELLGMPTISHRNGPI